MSRRTRVVAVVSGKGGSGKTMLACNLATLARREDQRVLVLDADLGMAGAQFQLGAQPRHTLGDVLAGRVSLRNAITADQRGVHLLSAGAGVAGPWRLDEAQRQHLIGSFDSVGGEHDLVLVDCASGLGDDVMFFAGAAHEVMVVVAPDPAAVVHAATTIRTLREETGTKDFHVVLNLVPERLTARALYEQLQGKLAGCSVRLRYLGAVPDDTTVRRSVMAQRPVVDMLKSSTAAKAMQSVHARLMTEAPSVDAAGGLKLLWDHMVPAVA